MEGSNRKKGREGEERRGGREKKEGRYEGRGSRMN